MGRKKRKPAFGSVSKRFENLGLHPSWERRGYTYKYPSLAPGCYYTETKRKLKGVGYDRSLESEELSRTLAHRADHILKEKSWQKSINGPGWQDVPNRDDFSKSGTFTTAVRFPVSSKRAIPGPGIYGKDHIPHTRLEEKSKSKAFSFSNTPSFEYDNFMPRSLTVTRSYHLPPNIYKVKSSIEELVTKVVSKRGPYSLFTGPRDASSLYGHMAALRMGSGDSYPDIPSTLDKLNNTCNRYKGRFSRCGRETYPTMRFVLSSPRLAKPDPDSPAPNLYDPRGITTKPTSVLRFPFGSSTLHVRPMKKIEFKPPPGRYNPGPKRDIRGGGHRSAFLSKTKRGIPEQENTSWFPRR